MPFPSDTRMIALRVPGVRLSPVITPIGHLPLAGLGIDREDPAKRFLSPGKEPILGLSVGLFQLRATSEFGFTPIDDRSLAPLIPATPISFDIQVWPCTIPVAASQATSPPNPLKVLIKR